MASCSSKSVTDLKGFAETQLRQTHSGELLRASGKYFLFKAQTHTNTEEHTVLSLSLSHTHRCSYPCTLCPSFLSLLLFEDMRCYLVQWEANLAPWRKKTKGFVEGDLECLHSLAIELTSTGSKIAFGLLNLSSGFQSVTPDHVSISITLELLELQNQTPQAQPTKSDILSRSCQPVASQVLSGILSMVKYGNHHAALSNACAISDDVFSMYLIPLGST